jgi:exo-1,4-beta-D-glucosaminidase
MPVSNSQAIKQSEGKLMGNSGNAKARQLLSDNWQLKSSFLVKEDGKQISTVGYQPNNWYLTSVPSTILTTLVRNGVYPDPRNGLDCYLIPDASDEFNLTYDLAKFSYLPDKRNPWKDPYWYRTEFILPSVESDQHTWLNFNCINYRAEVWLNGMLVAGKDSLVGMFQRFRLDVAQYVNAGVNGLAVKIFPMDHPGTPQKQLEVFGRPRNYGGEIYRDVSQGMSIGYDCMMTVPDRNIGICQEVYIDWSGSVDIRNPFVITDLQLPDTSRAELAITAELTNAGIASVKGVLKGKIPGTDLEFSKVIELGPGETRLVSLESKAIMENPHLWWPLNYGRQYLYDLILQFFLDGKVSDEQVVQFGVRKITSVMHKLGTWHGRQIHVNGQKIYCRGGYIQPELMLDWSNNRIRKELNYYANENMNLIYFEDIPNPPDAFLDECDRLGVLFGNVFYASNWVNEGNNYPDDFNLLETCTIDLLKRYRNHPSMIMYMAQNEFSPREQAYVMWRKHVKELDGTRFWIPSGFFPDSKTDVPEWFKEDLPTGMNDAGGNKSYGWREPVSYFKWVREDGSWMFKIENGSASLPPISSLAKFIPDLGKQSTKGAPFPITETWAHHGANSYYKQSDEAIRRLHGEPESVADYCWKAHLITADQQRSQYEAVNHRLWDITSGFTQWKINSSYPDIQWQNFDYYFKPGVSHFYIKRACEPVHVQLNLIDGMVSIINTRLVAQSGIHVSARIFDLDSKLLWEKTGSVDVQANSYKEAFIVPEPSNASSVYFVKLEIKDYRDQLLSENFYWLRNKNTSDYKSLQDMEPVQLSVRSTMEYLADNVLFHVKLTNPTDRIAFFTQLALTKPDGNEVLPVMWDANYFTLLPGESREISARMAVEDVGTDKLKLEIGGWNIQTEYKCTNLKILNEKIKQGEEFTVVAGISGTFLDGSRVWLLADGKPSESGWAWARGDKTDEIKFKLSLSTPGKHELKIGERKINVVIE